jgi:uncharacterized protein YjiS (DUF1127 family)
MTTISLTGFLTLPHGRRIVAEFSATARQRLAAAWRNYTTRRDLAGMDDRMLQDLGISRAQARFEARRPIWR